VIAYDTYDDLGSEARSLQAVEERFDELKEELAEQLASIGYALIEEEE
jgi:hypothetical protein